MYKKRFSKFKERAIEGLLLFSALSSIFITLSIVFILFYEALGFFKDVSVWEFLTGTQWTPLFAQPKFGILPLVTGTLLVTGIAVLVSLPIGLIVAVYLSEYAPFKAKEVAKPILELLAAVPTVVYGYFALLFLTPILQKIIPNLSGLKALSPGIIMGIDHSLCQFGQ
jgi:phosphate transport system permease protein